MKHHLSSTRGSTLAETMVGAGVIALVGGLIGSALYMSSVLVAKNAATNLSHHSLRTSIDQLAQEISTSQGKVVLLSPTGGTVSSGSAAGIGVDVLVGVPYVVTHPGGSGISASAMSVTMARSTSSAVTAPIPKPGEVLLLDGAPDTRLKIATATAGGAGGATQTITLTLSSAAGTAIPWNASTVKTAHLVRRAVYVVVPSGGRNQLRYFPSAETVANYSTATGYQIVDQSLGTASGDGTPFSLTPVGSLNFVKISLNFNRKPLENAIAARDTGSFATMGRAEFVINPRGW